ncbi:hypothetical protein BUALT_Bualt16G0098100 [Buddleja alternifolia]|uniref:Myb/SANT-like domain-containing protein n=1 Tax=Buddleja alternifolia TaxID=168488 RepID=A0AAV6WL20_9LAMI|nr:hypothetical protein BUALT_Bualt16G0098100 [Buddleja alternifolia]
MFGEKFIQLQGIPHAETLRVHERDTFVSFGSSIVVAVAVKSIGSSVVAVKFLQEAWSENYLLSDDSTVVDGLGGCTWSAVKSTRYWRQRGKNIEITEKANWDPKTTEVFIKLCVEELQAGNRPGSHFNRLGWENITRKFTSSTNRNYTRLQLKNKWDHLKKEWGIWKTLLRGESGLGWNTERGTVDQTPEWWQRKLQEVPDAAKYRERGPMLLNEQEMLFSDVVATGGSAWTPSSGILPPHLMDESDEDSHLHANDVNDHENDPVAETDMNTNTQAESASAAATTGNRRRNVKFIARRFMHTKTKKMSSADKIAHCLQRLVDTVEHDSARSSNDTSRQYTIQQCMDILEEISGIQQGDKLWMYATRLFLKPAIREMFLTIKTNDLRFMWLQDQMERDQERRTPWRE